MSGHSKWAQIKRQKGVADVKRGLTFTKLSIAVTIAVKQGGGIVDPAQNFRLRLAIEAARAANMPKDNIERAIKRAVDKGAGEIHEVFYEGFAPGGVSIIVEAATDNPQRTTSEIKSLFHKSGASFGQPGSVSYQFKISGKITVRKGKQGYDELLTDAIEFGATDMEEDADNFYIYTEVSDLAKVRNSLVESGVEVVLAEIDRKAISKISIEDEEKLGKIADFINEIEALDDVQKVYTNLL